MVEFDNLMFYFFPPIPPDARLKFSHKTKLNLKA